jgi:hypothetical protein
MLVECYAVEDGVHVLVPPWHTSDDGDAAAGAAAGAGGGAGDQVWKVEALSYSAWGYGNATACANDPVIGVVDVSGVGEVGATAQQHLHLKQHSSTCISHSTRAPAPGTAAQHVPEVQHNIRASIPCWLGLCCALCVLCLMCPLCTPTSGSLIAFP